MKKLYLSIIMCAGLLLAAAQVQAQAPAVSAPADQAVKIIKVNFAQVYDVATVLTQIKGPEGKVIANEEAQSVVLMDTPDRIKAMEALIRQMDIQTVTVEIPLKFSRANEVLDNVRSLLTQSIGTINADMKANKIRVTDTPLVVEKVRKAVEALDPRGRKIILEAKLVHVVLDDEHLDGVDWSGIVADHQNFKLEGKGVFLGGKDRGESLSIGTIEGADFIPLIEALDTVGIVKEYPVTDVPVMSDSEVKMVVHLDEPDVTLEEVVPGAAEPAPSEGVAVEFRIKPQVDVDGTLKTQIDAHAAKALPAQGRKAHSITVRSLEGGSIIIGGLIATEQVLTQRKIPLIGDLPLLGFAFRYHNSSMRREEFVVMLTPKVVAPDIETPATEAEK
ncbi:MAG: secretin N-terminal domain-containing protein [Candidatus Omnitrophota bacterium]